MDTRHQRTDVAYPVLVDPEFIVKEDWACSTGPSCVATWFHGNPLALDGLNRFWSPMVGNPFGPTTPANWGMAKNCLYAPAYAFNNCYGYGAGGGTNWIPASNGWSQRQTGTHVWAAPGYSYPGGQLAEYAYVPPGQTTRIYRTDFGAKFLRGGVSNGGLRMFTGIWSIPQNYWAGSPGNPSGYALRLYDGSEDGGGADGVLSQRWDASWGYGAPGPQAAAFGIANVSSNPANPPGYVNAYMGAAVVQLTDPEAPTVSSVSRSGPSGWTGDGAAWTIRATASDAGLGMRVVRLYSGSRLIEQRGVWCTATSANPCPRATALDGTTPNFGYPDEGGTAHAAPFTVRSDDLPEGEVPLTLLAADALGEGLDQYGSSIEHATRATSTVKIDRSLPSSAVSGTLKAYDGKWVPDGSYSIDVRASDALSGVQKISVKVDGATRDSKVQTDPTDAASLEATFDLDTAPLKYGAHSVEVITEDRAGNTSTEQFSFYADARNTTFTFAPDLALSEVASIEQAGDEIISIKHVTSQDDVEGYELEGEPLSSALTSFREIYQEETGTQGEPRVRELTFGGSVPTAALGDAAAKVESREEVALAQLPQDAPEPNDGSDENLLEYLDSLLAEDVAADDQDLDERSEEPQATVASKKKFAPEFGQVRTFDVAGSSKPRRISQTFRWLQKGWQNEFDNTGYTDDAYEHDFKLFNFNTPRGLRYQRPLCGSLTQRFWATRTGRRWKALGAGVDDAKPYFDTDKSDECYSQDFTIGFYRPKNLVTGRRYRTYVRTAAGTLSTSAYKVTAQRLKRTCPDRVLNPFCVGVVQKGGDFQPLAGGRAPDCRRWRNGRRSRACP